VYCQREIEDETPCETQCEHCNKYYEPLEIDHAAQDYADSGEFMMNLLVDDEFGVNRAIKSFIAGALFYKNYINETDPEKKS
jgi:hypothetical protein